LLVSRTSSPRSPHPFPTRRSSDLYLPLTYAIRSMRAVGLAGAGWADVRADALALMVFAAAFLVVGWLSFRAVERMAARAGTLAQDRKSTRLNSSHVKISYAVFCLK